MGDFFGFFIGFVVGLVSGMILMSSLDNSKIANGLSNVMNASMLDCVTHGIITKDQVHDIESVFFKHIEENFKGIKASHCDNYIKDKE